METECACRRDNFSTTFQIYTISKQDRRWFFRCDMYLSRESILLAFLPRTDSWECSAGKISLCETTVSSTCEGSEPNTVGKPRPLAVGGGTPTGAPRTTWGGSQPSTGASGPWHEANACCGRFRHTKLRRPLGESKHTGTPPGRTRGHASRGAREAREYQLGSTTSVRISGPQILASNAANELSSVVAPLARMHEPTVKNRITRWSAGAGRAPVPALRGKPPRFSWAARGS